MLNTVISGNRKQILEYNDLQTQGSTLLQHGSSCSIRKKTKRNDQRSV